MKKPEECADKLISNQIGIIKKIQNDAYNQGIIDFVKQRIKNKYAEAINTVVVEFENPHYTPEDMQEFIVWADANGWFYGTFSKCWLNNKMSSSEILNNEGKYTIEEVLAIWKKEAKK